MQGPPALFGARRPGTNKGNGGTPETFFSVWYRATVHVPSTLKGRSLALALGVIDDEDETYVNGVKVGETTRLNSKTPWADNRLYAVPPDILRYGEDNVIAFRMTDYQGGWGGAALGPEVKLLVPGDDGESLYVEPLTPEDNPYRVRWW